MKSHTWGLTLKHFVISGLVFGLAPLLVVDVFIGIGLAILNDRLGFSASDSYVTALMVTVFLIAVLAVCIAVGNRFVAKRVIPSIEHLNMVHSTVMFALFVVLLITLEFMETTEFDPSFIGFSRENPIETLQMISLPIIKIISLPTLYYFLSTRQLSYEPA